VGPLDIFLAVVGLSILVIVHESGHYLAARAFKMKVLRYSIGFGPTLFKYQPKGSDTVFQVAAIPFLAYVQIAGMNPYEENEPGEEGLFDDASRFGRIVTIAAGPFANYLTAAIIALAIGLVGWPPGMFHRLYPDDVRVEIPAIVPIASDIIEDSAAAEAGVEVGDQIVAVAGTDVANMEELREQTQAHGGEATVYEVLRDGERLSLTVTPRVIDGNALIGMQAESPDIDIGPVQLGIGEAAKLAIVVPYKLSVMQLTAIKNMILQLDSSNLGGPVAIVKGFGAAAQQGVVSFFLMMMMMSVALGFFNLLPFPALDGGRLLFLFFEVITRRKPNARFEAAVHTIGILILLVVLALVTVRDIAG
jgi:regulator of sigma E protease